MIQKQFWLQVSALGNLDFFFRQLKSLLDTSSFPTYNFYLLYGARKFSLSSLREVNERKLFQEDVHLAAFLSAAEAIRQRVAGRSKGLS